MVVYRYITFTTDSGWVGILSSVRGLIRLTLPQDSAREASELLGSSLSHATRSPRQFEDIISRLRVYLAGRKAAFPDELDLSRATSFQRQVWRITRLIPYGESRSYRWLAVKISKPNAMRAVGQALAQNPLPIIIPCHRVVASNGKLGGYSGGLEWKRYLLHLEAVARRGETLVKPAK